MPERERRSLLDRLLEALLGEALRRVRGYVEKQLGHLIQRAIPGLFGAVLAAAGLLFLALAVVKYLSLLMPSWLAWGLVGLIMALLGIVVLMGTVIKLR